MCTYTLERIQSTLLWWWQSARLWIEAISCHIELRWHADTLLIHSVPSLTIWCSWNSCFINFTLTAHILFYFKSWNFRIIFLRCFDNSIRSNLQLTWNICVDALRGDGGHVRFTFIILDRNRIIFRTFPKIDFASFYFPLSVWRNVQIHLKFRGLYQNLILRVIAYTVAFGCQTLCLECISFFLC